MVPDSADSSELPDSADSAEQALHARSIKSFVTRQGRVSNAQARALEVLLPQFGIPYAPTPLDWAQCFVRTSPVIVEIGFGMGETTANIAAALPETNFLGIEVHNPGVGALLKEIGERGLSNLRIIQHDAVEVLTHMVPQASVDGIHIFFPDPWHKKRHNKRRLIQSPLVALLASRLAAGGYVHCATDWEPYAQQMLEVLSAEPALVNTAPGFAPRPAYRPITKFESRGIRLGHGVWDVIFRKKSS